jgi:signal transduction histidine kinase
MVKYLQRFDTLLACFLLCFCCMPYSCAHGQTAGNLHIDTIDGFAKLRTSLSYYYDSTGSEPISDAVNRPYTPVRKQVVFANNFYKGHYFIRFSIFNAAGSNYDSIYFYPGYAIRTIMTGYDSITRQASSNIQPEKIWSIFSFSPVQCFKLHVPRGTLRTFYFQPEFHYYNWQNLNPVLVKKDRIDDMLYELNIHGEISFLLITIFFMGILFTMCIYACVKYYQTKLPEFVFYGLSTIAFIIYFGYQALGLFISSHTYNSLDTFLRQFLQIGAHILYMLFATYFLNIRKNLPVLFKIMIGIFVILLLHLIIISYTAFFDQYHLFNRRMFDFIRILLLLYSLYAIPVLYRSKIPLASYVATGALSVSIFAGIAFYLTNMKNYGLDAFPFLFYLGGPIFFFKLGILAEQICFTLGLSYKARREEAERLKAVEVLKLDNEKKEIEKIMAVMESRDLERNRIAQEIHDDMGSGLTTIRLLSEITMAKMPEAHIQEMEKISSSADELVDKMNEIIWSINTKNDSLPNLVAYIRSHIVSYLEPFNIESRVNIPEEMPNKEISGESRRNIFLVVKESMNNVVKHAQATRVTVSFCVGKHLDITITDDGVGIDEHKIKPYSNGIRNMRERMENIGGTFSMKAGDEKGTVVALHFPLG